MRIWVERKRKKWLGRDCDGSPGAAKASRTARTTGSLSWRMSVHDNFMIIKKKKACSPCTHLPVPFKADLRKANIGRVLTPIKAAHPARVRSSSAATLIARF